MNKTLEFRKILAEMGIETTPEQASRLYKMASRIVKTAKKMPMDQIWKFDDVEGFSEEEIKQIKELYLSAKEL
jgi:hypothetical protein